MVRKLTILPDIHYTRRETTRYEWKKERFADSDIARDNKVSKERWERLEQSANLDDRKFDALYHESICSFLQARAFREKYMNMKCNTDDKGTYYVQKWLSEGTDVRHTENIVWYNLHWMFTLPDKPLKFRPKIAVLNNIHRVARFVGFCELGADSQQTLIDIRDRCMACNIDYSLKDGEEAILVVGDAHCVEQHLKKLAPGIKLELPSADIHNDENRYAIVRPFVAASERNESLSIPPH